MTYEQLAGFVRTRIKMSHVYQPVMLLALLRGGGRFGVRDWDTDALLTSEGWTESKRILMFAVYNTPTNLDLNLFMGPGPEETRRRLFELHRRAVG